MTTRARRLPGPVAVMLALVASTAFGQDPPLYRDPSPMEGPQVVGPLLRSSPPSPSQAPPPPSTLGPFRSPDAEGVAPAPGFPREPLLIVPPMAPPAPAYVLPMLPPDGAAEFRRKTTIRPPGGVIGQYHDRLRLARFAPRNGPDLRTSPPSKHGFLWWCFHHDPAETDAQINPFHRPSWPSWPLRDGR